MPVAACIAGGGSRGIIQLGFLKAFQEFGPKPDAIYSGSVGCLNAMLYLQDEMPKLEDLWLNIKTKDVYKSRILSLWKLLTNDASIYDSAPLEKLIREYLNMRKIKNLKIPFMVNTTNLSTYQPECKDIRSLNFEDAVQWLKASASPPILFPSVTHPLGELVDCGLLSNYAILQAVKDGYDTIICMTPTRAVPTKPTNLLKIIEATISTASYGYLEREIQGVEEINREINECNKDFPEIKLVIIRPQTPWNWGLLDFNYKQKREDLIQYGYNIAKEILLREFPLQSERRGSPT